VKRVLETRDLVAKAKENPESQGRRHGNRRERVIVERKYAFTSYWGDALGRIAHLDMNNRSLISGPNMRNE
jgi:hypothetical protein